MSRAHFYHLSTQQLHAIRQRYPYPRQAISKEMSTFARHYGLTGRQLSEVIFRDWTRQWKRRMKQLGRM